MFANVMRSAFTLYGYSLKFTFDQHNYTKFSLHTVLYGYSPKLTFDQQDYAKFSLRTVIIWLLQSKIDL